MSDDFSLAPVEVVLASASLLGGIAGHRGGIETETGWRVWAPLDQIVVTADHPRRSRLHDALEEPLEELSRKLRAAADSVPRDMVKRSLEIEGKSECHELLDNRSRQNKFMVGEETHALLSFVKPGIRMRNPRPGTLRRGWTDMLEEDGHLVLDDGRLARAARLRRLGKALKEMLEDIDALMRGTDHWEAKPDRRRQKGGLGYNETHMRRASVLIRCSEAELQSLLESRHPEIQAIVSRCLIVNEPPACVEPGRQPSAVDSAAAHRHWRESAVRIVQNRRSGRPEIWYIKSILAKLRMALEEDYFRLLESLGIGTAHLADLPLKLLWAVIVSAPVERDEYYSALRWCYDQAGRLAEKQAEIWKGSSKVAVLPQEDPAERMLGKLRDKGPCMFRDLIRSYSGGRKGSLEPVLQKIVDEGKVKLDDDGLIRLVENDKKSA